MRPLALVPCQQRVAAARPCCAAAWCGCVEGDGGAGGTARAACLVLQCVLRALGQRAGVLFQASSHCLVTDPKAAVVDEECAVYACGVGARLSASVEIANAADLRSTVQCKQRCCCGPAVRAGCGSGLLLGSRHGPPMARTSGHLC